MDSLGISLISDHVVCEWSTFSFLSWMFFFFLFSNFFLARTSSTILNTGGKSEYCCFVPDNLCLKYLLN